MEPFKKKTTQLQKKNEELFKEEAQNPVKTNKKIDSASEELLQLCASDSVRAVSKLARSSKPKESLPRD